MAAKNYIEVTIVGFAGWSTLYAGSGAKFGRAARTLSTTMDQSGPECCGQPQDGACGKDGWAEGVETDGGEQKNAADDGEERSGTRVETKGTGG
jgi:hypothetical protein